MEKYSRVAVIVSNKDPAGLNIKQRLLELFPFKENSAVHEGEKVYALENLTLYTTQIESIDCNNIHKSIEADLFVFATKHRAESGKHSLSVHVPGNWGKAELGGFDKKLCKVPASLIKNALLVLQEKAKDLDCEVTVEATHHGPFIEKPCFFIEIGSSEEQWKKTEPAKIIAETLIEVLEKREEISPTVIVLGGGHYNQTANKIIARTKYAVGHICAKYALPDFDNAMLQQALGRTVEDVELIVLDWKGLGDQKEKIKTILESAQIKSERAKNFLRMD